MTPILSKRKSGNPKAHTTKKAERAERALQTISHAGTSFSHKHYVLISKLKSGELWALNHLSPTAKGSVTPLFEMWPPKQGGKQFVDHTNHLLQLVLSEWGMLPFFIDTRYLLSGGVPSAAATKLMLDAARSKNLAVVPVTSLNFSPAFQTEIRNALTLDGRGVMIRLFLADFRDPNLLPQYLIALVQFLGLNPSAVDILIDLEHRPEQVEVQQIGNFAIRSLPNIAQWRTVTFASGCFPDSISNKTSGVWHQFPRADWLGWLNINSAQVSAGQRQASFGDYGIRCGGIPREIPNGPAPNIRYTDPQQILVRRESKALGTMRTICSSLTGKNSFYGAQFSKGDAEIAARAAMPSSSKNGSPADWIQWCTNHHLELTASQILSLP
jgi:hypothetical protein